MILSSDTVHNHAAFLGLVPTIERRARFALRGRPSVDQEEAAAEAIATAYAAQARLSAVITTSRRTIYRVLSRHSAAL